MGQVTFCLFSFLEFCKCQSSITVHLDSFSPVWFSPHKEKNFSGLHFWATVSLDNLSSYTGLWFLNSQENTNMMAPACGSYLLVLLLHQCFLFHKFFH